MEFIFLSLSVTTAVTLQPNDSAAIFIVSLARAAQ